MTRYFIFLHDVYRVRGQVRFAESEPGLFSLVGLDDSKIAAQNRTANESEDVVAINSKGETLLFEGKIADWCTEGLPVLYRPAFPNGIASPGHVDRLLPGTHFSYRSSRPMTVRQRARAHAHVSLCNCIWFGCIHVVHVCVCVIPMYVGILGAGAVPA